MTTTATAPTPATTKTWDPMAHAVRTALSALDIDERIVAPEHLSPMVIVRKDSGRLAVYSANAWTRPTEQPMLPWSAPLGTPVATVNLDRSVTLLP